MVERGGQTNTPGALRVGDTGLYCRAREGERLNTEWWFANWNPRHYLARFFQIYIVVIFIIIYIWSLGEDGLTKDVISTLAVI